MISSLLILVTAVAMSIVAEVAVAVIWIRREIRNVGTKIQQMNLDMARNTGFSRPMFDKMSPEELDSRLAALRAKESSDKP